MKNKLSHISKKSKMIAATAFVLGLVAVGGGVANADTAPNVKNNPMSSVVNAIATKFNLNSTEVQAVVDDVMKTEHAKMEATQKQERVTRLAAAVTAGTITQAQADLIVAKAAEIKAEREADRATNQTLTDTERQAKMQTERTELKDWATANKIPEQFLRAIGEGPGHGKPGSPEGRGGFHPLKPAQTK